MANSSALFQWTRTARAEHLHNALAHQGILTRLFSKPSSLRLGLPGRTADWQRLDAALDLVPALDLIGVDP